jgi:hypothetical protein
MVRPLDQSQHTRPTVTYPTQRMPQHAPHGRMPAPQLTLPYAIDNKEGPSWKTPCSLYTLYAMPIPRAPDLETTTPRVLFYCHAMLLYIWLCAHEKLCEGRGGGASSVASVTH